MKKISLVLIAALLAGFPVVASAQDSNPSDSESELIEENEDARDDKEKKDKKEKKVRKYGYFNHFGVGAGVGIMDGVSLVAGMPIGSHFQIRGGYSMGVPDQIYKLEYQVPDLGTQKINSTEVALKDIKISGEITRTYNAFLDIYPFKKRAFHFTVGLMGYQETNIFTVAADLSKPLHDAFGDDDYSTYFVEFNDDATGDRIRISPDKDGVLHAALRTRDEIRPYFGIGFGRVANIKHWMSLSLDLGVQKIGGYQLAGYDYDGKEQIFTSGLIGNKDHIDDESIPVIGGKGIIDAIGEFPWMPVFRLGINIRLF